MAGLDSKKSYMAGRLVSNFDDFKVAQNEKKSEILID